MVKKSGVVAAVAVDAGFVGDFRLAGCLERPREAHLDNQPTEGAASLSIAAALAMTNSGNAHDLRASVSM